ncbi:MAG: ABC transporter permease [Clostridiales bacterium]|jgi:peptide/nickel transport system permease protein|nr:ABC transporter permease [Clostridiales bacterium]
MLKYILKRLLMMIPVILCVAILVFTIIYFTPGDAAQVVAGQGTPAEKLDELRESMGLNDPYFVQLGRYLHQVFVKLDLGTAMVNKTSITSDMQARFPYSMTLALIGIAFAICVGIPLGVYSALHQNKVGDRIAVVVSMLGVSVPHFWLALMLILLFSVKLGWLPAYGVGGIAYWIMPIIANCVGGMATTARQTRSSMLEVIHCDYIVTARSKGLKQSQIILRHMLPNALIPIITVTGMNFGGMLGGGLIIEQIFTIPGVGFYLTKGITQRDYYAVMGGVILLSVAFSVIMLATDLIQAFVDPRIKAQYAGDVKRRRKPHAREA